MRTLFDQMLDYNFYCNKKIIGHLVEQNKVPLRAQTLFSHILNAHHIWNKKLLGEDGEYGVWQEHPIAYWQAIHDANQRTTFEILSNTEDFAQRINYVNSKGKTFSNALKDILFHIINHSTHHRGQLIANLKDHQIVIGPLDYIFYKRQH